MNVNKKSSENGIPEERVLFTLRGSVKKRLVTAAVFGLFLLMTLAGALILKSVNVTVMGAGALILSFWPLADAFDRIAVSNLRIRYSKFSKFTANLGQK